VFANQSVQSLNRFQRQQTTAPISNWSSFLNSEMPKKKKIGSFVLRDVEEESQSLNKEK
jgi:hypothetical protein